MRGFRYFRIYADPDGESHFEDATVSLQPADYAPPAPPLDHLALGNVTTLALIGGDDTWKGETYHPAPARQFMFALRGHGTVTVSDGSSRAFGPGDVFLLEDTSGKGHATRFAEECIFAAVRLAE
ncbi:MAG: hypothetical protein HYX50_01495 [Chloroflexi bacterium]|nr:hypothetical protein [Chloroflexota bacterium]